MTIRAPRARRAAAAAVALTALAAPAAFAEDWSFTWSNGFKLDSPDKRFQLKLGGRVQADFSFADADGFAVEDGFEFRRARLFMEGDVYDRVEFKAEYDFANGDAAMKDVYVGLVTDWGGVRFGHFKEPMSLEELTSSKYLTFLERSLPIEAFVPSRNAGVGVHGGGDAFNWGVGWFYDTDDFGKSVDEDDTNLTGRFVYRPVLDADNLIHLGVAATRQERGAAVRYRSRPEAHLAPRFVDTGAIPADGATTLGVELAGRFGAFWTAAEYLQADVDAVAASDPSFDGFYLQAGWFVTGERRAYKASGGSWDRVKPADSLDADGGPGAWEIALRYSSLDLTDAGVAGGELEDVTLGVNWYLNPVTRLMLDVVHADREGGGEGDFVLARWAIDF